MTRALCKAWARSYNVWRDMESSQTRASVVSWSHQTTSYLNIPNWWQESRQCWRQSKIKGARLCTEFTSLCWTATVLEGLFGEYHSSSAALGQQRPDIAKQPLVCDWLVIPEIYYIHPCTNLPLYFEQSDGLTSSAFQGLPANHVQVVGYFWTLLAQCCWWGVVFSKKAPSSTVAVQHHDINLVQR